MPKNFKPKGSISDKVWQELHRKKGGATASGFKFTSNEELKQKPLLSVDKVKDLLKGGFDVNEKDANGKTLLFRAVMDDNSELVELLLSTDGIKVNEKNDADDEGGLTPLMWACFHGQDKVVKSLLGAEGIEVNEKNSDEEEGNTALMYAAMSLSENEEIQVKVLKMMLEAPDIQIDMKNHDDQTALDCCYHDMLKDLIVSALANGVSQAKGGISLAKEKSTPIFAVWDDDLDEHWCFRDRATADAFSKLLAEERAKESKEWNVTEMDMEAVKELDGNFADRMPFDDVNIAFAVYKEACEFCHCESWIHGKEDGEEDPGEVGGVKFGDSIDMFGRDDELGDY
ncbi:hypothetical protein TrRE_jg13324 [Triparma retinervis]|uniref:Uncharacterized protein n=1 Tax=Triparma retinervis TaxID=2557542 RepID=A0A9W6ZFK4_9STRA|nr:hypothetical protein TrRE_jg13324 [Triparma retinervis]